jgi:hypothetical protein
MLAAAREVELAEENHEQHEVGGIPRVNVTMRYTKTNVGDVMLETYIIRPRR